MRFLTSEVTTPILTALGTAGAWFATWLARRGKKEDTRTTERTKAFEEVSKLSRFVSWRSTASRPSVTLPTPSARESVLRGKSDGTAR
jgi:hypothetical protein